MPFAGFGATAAVCVAALAVAASGQPAASPAQDRRRNIDGTYLRADVQYERGATPSGPEHIHGIALGSGAILQIDNPSAAQLGVLGGLASGSDRVRVSSGVVGNGAIRLDDGATVRVIGRGRRQRRMTKENIDANYKRVGDKSVLVVRAVARNTQTSASEAQLVNDVFTDSYCLRTQFARCSNNKLTFSAGAKQGAGMTNDGVLTVTIGNRIRQNTADGQIRDAMVSAAQSYFGVSSLDPGVTNGGPYDYVMLCVPPGTQGSWIAYAWIGWYLSVYNDNWCRYVSAQMHEVGHNLGLGHSGEGSDAYGDTTGMMGYSYGPPTWGDDTPRMCFNNAKNYQLGWFHDAGTQHVVDLCVGAGFCEWNSATIVRSFDGHLVGAADYASAASSDTIVINVFVDGNSFDWFIGFNAASGFNDQTQENGNQVTIHTKTSPDSGANPSSKVAALGAGGTYDFGSNTVLTVNSINLGATPPYADVTIVTATPEPTQSPTLSPTPSPTVPQPTQSPTVPQPTQSPSPAPTDSPTVSTARPVTCISGGGPNRRCLQNAERCCSGRCSNGGRCA